MNKKQRIKEVITELERITGKTVVLKESVNHATYFCFSICHDFNICNLMTAENDLAADAYMDGATKYNSKQNKYLYAVATTDGRWHEIAELIAKDFKEGMNIKQVREKWDRVF